MNSGSQLFRCPEPVFVRRPFRTASRPPQFMSQCRYVVMSESRDAMSHCCRVRMLMGFLGVFQGLPGMFLARQVFLLSVLLRHSMRVRRAVV